MKKTNEMTLYIPVGTKKFPLIIRSTGKVDPEDGELVEVYCKEANLDQEYLKSDLTLLLQDIWAMIEAEQAQKKDDTINIRVKARDKVLLQQYASAGGYRSLSEYLVAKGLQTR